MPGLQGQGSLGPTPTDVHVQGRVSQSEVTHTCSGSHSHTPRTAPRSIPSGRNTAPTNVHMILSPSDSVTYSACKILERVLQPVLLWAPGGQPLPGSTCWEPLCLQEEGQEDHRLCHRNEKLSKRDVLLPGPKTSLQFLDPQTPRSAAACPAGPLATP